MKFSLQEVNNSVLARTIVKRESNSTKTIERKAHS